MMPPDSPSDESGRLPAGGAVSAETVRVLREATGEEAYAQIRAEFLSSTECRLAAMARAAEGDDAEALRRAAHALRGASGSLGAIGLEAHCRALEASLAAGMPPGERPAAVARMTAEFAAVRRALLEEP
ncbi:MAG: Hpt domain-containing protein [Elusimicrobiota bacterium]